MLHKSKLMLPILAAIVGVAASAFTVGPTNQASQKAVLYWYNYDPQSGKIVSEIGHFDEQQAETVTGCQDIVTTICAKGYSSEQTGLPKPAPAGATDLRRTEN